MALLLFAEGLCSLFLMFYGDGSTFFGGFKGRKAMNMTMIDGDVRMIGVMANVEEKMNDDKESKWTGDLRSWAAM